jgi:hypothetical protein
MKPSPTQSSASTSSLPALERDARFDEDLDAEGAIEVAGSLFAPSEVLARLDPLAYGTARDLFRKARRADAPQIATQEYPYPIAHCTFRFLRGWETQNKRAQFLKDTWEALIAVVFALALAELRSVGQKVTVKTDKVRNFRRHLDSWNIRDHLEVLAVTARSPVSLPFFHALGGEQIVEGLIALNQRRHESLAHLGTLNETRSRELVDELWPDVVSILDAASPLGDLELIRYVGPTEPRGYHRLEVFRGHASTQTFDDRKLASLQAAALASRSRTELFAMLRDQVLPLSPMLRWREARGSQSDIGFFKKRSIRAGRSVFSFEVFGTSECFETDDPALQEDLDAIKSLFVQGE